MPPANATPAPPAAELNEMHNARGLTYRQMASFYGVGLATIRRWMDEQSVPRMQSGKRLVDPSAPERTRPSKAELERLYAEGLSQKAIAKKLGFGHSTVNMWFREYGIATRPGTRSTVDITSHEYEFLPDSDALDSYTPDPLPVPPPRTGRARQGRPSKAELERLYETMSKREIAEHLGFGKSTVNMWIRKYGIVTKKPDPIPEKPRTEPDQATLFRLYHDEELNLAQIGERYGHSRNWAAKLMDKYGIERRQKGWLPPEPDSYTPDPLPVPPPRTGRARQGRPPERAFLRLSETERRIVARRVDDFLIYAQVRKEPA